MTLNGQWIGRYSGTNNGTIVIEIDDHGDHYDGASCLWDDDPSHPSSVVAFRTPSKANTQAVNGATVRAVDQLGRFYNEADFQALKSRNLLFPETVSFEFEYQNNVLSVQWRTPVGSFGGGQASLPKTRAPLSSELRPLQIRNWEQFKKHVRALEPKRFIFRGHESSLWRLRTTFYRTGRANLERYLIQDINDLQKNVSALTAQAFDLSNPLHYGAFVNLVQHHGYPTPLLDWTWSPYVAAFFAYRRIQKGADRNSRKKIRIYKLNIFEWNKLRHFDKLFPAPLNVSVLDAIALGNPRVIPQQGISTISNVDDIESHIERVEQVTGNKYLEAIDLPVADRDAVMQELALMGITAGSLFPGLDGACESLRERNF